MATTNFRKIELGEADSILKHHLISFLYWTFETFSIRFVAHYIHSISNVNTKFQKETISFLLCDNLQVSSPFVTL